MPTASRDILDQAMGLIVPVEAQSRAVVARAYYACFHRCQDWEQSLPGLGEAAPRTKGVHQQLIERLLRPDKRYSKEQAKRSEWLGRKLDSLRNLRVRADYRLHESITEYEAQTQLRTAEALFNRCNRGRKS